MTILNVFSDTSVMTILNVF